MLIDGQSFQSIWVHPENNRIIQIIDQRWLPHEFIIEDIDTVEQMAEAIRDMHLRGAPLIGAAAAWGLYLACLNAPTMNWKESIQKAVELLRQTRPTAVDLFWALKKQQQRVEQVHTLDAATTATFAEALQIMNESRDRCRKIGLAGLPILQSFYEEKQDTIHILTHCNAGWLACVDYGTATSPIYLAHDRGIPVHVWVDETRPRNQGARLTAWELGQHGIPHTVIVDNMGGHLMQHGMVDMVIVGSDRTTCQGDVANKIGTYLKALAAYDNGVPFYVALPSSTIDWNLQDGISEIPIESREAKEVSCIQGWDGTQIKEVRLTPATSPALNYGFDVTPARLVSGLITERGVCPASEQGLLNLFPERNKRPQFE